MLRLGYMESTCSFHNKSMAANTAATPAIVGVSAGKQINSLHSVYSGRYKSKSKHQMHFRPDGMFSDEFEPGFYDVNTNLVFELL